MKAYVRVRYTGQATRLGSYGEVQTNTEISLSWADWQYVLKHTPEGEEPKDFEKVGEEDTAREKVHPTNEAEDEEVGEETSDTSSKQPAPATSPTGEGDETPADESPADGTPTEETEPAPETPPTPEPEPEPAPEPEPTPEPAPEPTPEPEAEEEQGEGQEEDGFEEIESYEELNTAQLKEQATLRNIPFAANARKETIIKLLEEADEAAAEEGE